MMTREEIIMEVEKIRECGYVGYTVQSQHALDVAIEKLKTEKPKGHWVDLREYCEHMRTVTGYVFVPSGIGNPSYCNQCWKSSKIRTSYCPNCGADMRGNNND